LIQARGAQNAATQIVKIREGARCNELGILIAFAGIGLLRNFD
jgi:hypothetical protein